ncbi:MAG: glycosyltransferase [Bacteroidota bacterium]
MLENLLLYSFITISVIHILYILINWKFILITETASLEDKGTVSVVVCAKNEEKNLPPLLESLKNQAYHDFEIVLINDASTDNTLEVFEEFSKSNSNVAIVNVAENDRFWRGKKFALTMGIKRAKNKYLLFTDADCVPVSENWISLMMNGYTEDKEVVLGYGAYRKTKGLLDKIVRFETVLTASNYFSYTKLFTPYMGVGRNLSYSKDFFLKNNGFFGHMDVASGDDDLIINKNSTKENTEIVFSPEAKTVSNPPGTWSEWFNQKRRHYTTSGLYSKKTKSLLGLQGLSHILFFSLLLALLLLKINPVVVISIFVLRTLIFSVTVSASSSKLEEKDLILLIPFLDIILIILQLIIIFSNKIIYPKRWD